MRIEVPFFKQTTPLNCGPTALRMVIAYFEGDPGIEQMEEKTRLLEGKALFTIQIAIAASLKGYGSEIYSKQISFNQENMDLDFYKKYADNVEKESEKLIDDAQKAGVKICETVLPLDKVLESLNPNSVPIVLLDWNVVTGQTEKGYQGHFVPLVGYDDTSVYVHNPGGDSSGAFMRIEKEVFDTARRAVGTDEDIVVVKRKTVSPKTL